MDKKVGLRRALWLFALALLVGCGIFVVGACSSGAPPLDTAGGTNLPPGTGGACATPGPGCACTKPGAAQACGGTVDSDGGSITCSSGTMVCGGGGTWGPCVGTLRSLSRSQLHPRNISNDAGACGDPCDPFCSVFGDTAGGIDAGPDTGLIVTDGGLTLIVSPAPPPIPCTGLTITPPDASVTITTLDASPALATSQFTAYYTPPNCFTGPATALWGVGPGASVATVDSTGNVSVVNPIAGTVGVNAYAGSCVGDGGCPHAALSVLVNVVDTANAPTGVTAGQLSGAGTGNDGLSILYPYNYTVLPLGLLPPTVQWTAPNGIGGITVTSGGSGYTAPVTVSLTGGGGSGATATATLASTGALALGSYTPTTTGAGYTSAPTASFSGGGTGVTYTTTLASTGSLATGSRTVTTAGAGYSSPPTLTFSNGGTGVTYTTTFATTGALQLSTYPVTTSGAGYTSAPTAAFSNSGTGVAYTTTLAATGSLSTGSRTVTTAGAGYTSAPTATFSNGGSGVTYTTTLATTGALQTNTYPVTTAGSGYTSAPTATFSASGTGVTYTTNLASTGALTTGSYTPTSPGSGYTSAPTATFSNGGTGVTYTTTLATTGSLATATYPVTTAGAGYTSAPTLAFSNGGTGYTAVANMTSTTSLKTGTYTVTTQGGGYTGTPTLAFSGGGTGVVYTVTMALPKVTSFTITNGGTGFTAASTVTFSGGGGTTQATYTPTIPVVQTLNSFTVSAGGTGFTAPSAVTFSGGGATTQGTYTPTIPLTYGLASLNVTGGGSGFTGPSTVTISGGGATTQATYTTAIPVKFGLASITITGGGSGFTGPSTVTFSGGGATTQATYTTPIPLTYGLASFNITGGGSGFTGPSTVTFSGGGATTQATYTTTIPLTFGLASITITGGGSGFTGPSTVTFSGGGATTQATYTTPIPLTYGLASFNITGGGSGFTGPSTVTFSGGGATTQATYTTAIPLRYGLASLNITGGGSGFTGPSTVTFSGGGGTTQATYTTPIPLTFGIASVTVTSPGANYTSAPTVGFSGGTGSGATAIANLNYTPPATAVKVSLLYPADGSLFTYSEIIPEQTSTYGGIALPSPIPAATFSPAVWAAFAQSAVGQNAYISVQRLVGSQLYPPKIANIVFATDQLKGNVYYNTYGTQYAYNLWPTRSGGYFGGATLAIRPGATTPSPIEGYTNTTTGSVGCRVCHVVSANGNRLITELGTSYTTTETLSLPTSTWFATSSNTSEQTMSANFAWAGLSPDASLLFTNGAGLAGASTAASSLYKMTNPAAPTAVSVTGLPNLKAGTPAFSADGSHIAFNVNGGSGTLTGLTGSGTASPDGVSLGAIDFNGTSTFSNARILATPGSKGLTAPSGGTDATGKVWFPSFIPDTNADVVFQYETYSNGRDTAGTRSQCDANGPTNCQNEGVHSELWWVPSASNSTSNRLNCANGISDTNCPNTTTGTNYLPAHASYSPQTSFVGGATNPTYGADWNLNYEPTILPQKIGGYYWMVFTSRRMYGDVATINPFWSDPRFQYIASVPTTKKLWVAAINPNLPAGTDPSYPAFYLDGQELLAGNSRGYFVLNACEPAGTTAASLCTSDLDCCAGEACVLDTPLATPATSHCSSNSVTCIADGQACSAAALCCDSKAVCTQGTCQVPPPIPYYQEADFVRDYVSPCAYGMRPIWHAWEYETTTPSDSSIIFVVQTSNQQSALTSSVDAGTTPTYDGEPVQLPTIVSGAPVTALAPGQDVETALLNAGQQSGTYLRVITRLMASSDGHSAPSISAWNQTVDCLPAQ